MIKRVFHIVLSAWLAILLLFGGTSKEFVHLFADHTDTVHCLHAEHEGLVIESEHHHCSFLQFSLTSFINDIQLPFVAVHHLQHIQSYQGLVITVLARTPHTVSLRGPPTA